MVLYGPTQKQRPERTLHGRHHGPIRNRKYWSRMVGPDRDSADLAETTFWALGVRFFHQAVFVATGPRMVFS